MRSETSTTNVPKHNKTAQQQLSRFEVTNLFGRYNHSIDFPRSNDGRPKASVVILHGPNGVGKTTVLRMIDGLLRLDFNPFRIVPFERATLTLSSNTSITVEAKLEDGRLCSLNVKYGDIEVLLHASKPGAMEEKDIPLVEKFRAKFFKERSSLSFEFIDTKRVLRQVIATEGDVEMTDEAVMWQHELDLRTVPYARNRKALARMENKTLKERISRFISEAQVNHRRFFAAGETNLFARILDNLSKQQGKTASADPLLERLRKVEADEKLFKRLGIETDRWDIANIEERVAKAAQGAVRNQAIVALGSLVEVIETRAAERRLLADRLQTFTRVVSEFLHDKKVEISGGELIIKRRQPENVLLTERQLSTGEFHLLYLLVAALETQRRGTVIAIDEPEMSMHLAWQRKLVRALVECASNAEPQFIFATHSPDIAADFPDALVAIPDGTE